MWHAAEHYRPNGTDMVYRRVSVVVHSEGVVQLKVVVKEEVFGCVLYKAGPNYPKENAPVR
jgi:hypothetical protein